MRFVAISWTLFALLSISCTHPPVAKETPVVQNTAANSTSGRAHSQPDRGQISSSSGAADAAYELQFIDTMIANDERVIDAAHLVPTRAEHPEMKLLAKNIAFSRQQEIADLRKWRQDWFGDHSPADNIDLPGMRESA